ncbi:30S ribosomal protein S6 modification protein [Vibrio cholerae O1 biovar El Tor]|nr:30S ribosomal protein S6 modification protein [Vibrio cholerae O1 biovar El Tor]
MFQHSKILVWYKIASQKVVLGEAHSDGTEDVVSLWLHAPTQFDNASNQGYWLSLFDDGGREIGNKWVSIELRMRFCVAGIEPEPKLWFVHIL